MNKSRIYTINGQSLTGRQNDLLSQSLLCEMVRLIKTGRSTTSPDTQQACYKRAVEIDTLMGIGVSGYISEIPADIKTL